MEISDNLLCLYSAEIVECDGSYVIEIPEQEVINGAVTAQETYRVGILGTRADNPEESTTDSQPAQKQRNQHPHETPPIDEGDVRDVEIVALGDQGDGIAKVERGYVVIVPGATIGDSVTVEVVHIAESYAIGEIIADSTDDDPGSE